MPYEIAGKNLMLNALGAVAVFVGLLNDSDIEISGGDPAYARKPIEWEVAEDGSMGVSNLPVFDIPAGTIVNKIIICSAISGGVIYGIYDATNEVFAGQGTYTIISGSLDLNL